MPPIDVDPRRVAPAQRAVRHQGRRRDRPGADRRCGRRRPARPRRRVAHRRCRCGRDRRRPTSSDERRAPRPGWSAPITTCTRRSPGGCRRRRARRPASSRSSSRSGGASTPPSTSRCSRWSAMLGALEALSAARTAIIDHHECPNAIEGSLVVIADACAEVGVRVVVRLRRHRPPRRPRRDADGARRGLAENERFLRRGGRGMVGVHAAFTCSRRHARGRRRPRPPTSASACTSTSPRAPSTRDAGDRLAPLAHRRLAARALRPPRPRPAGHDRPQPPLQHEQRRRLRPPGRRVRQPGRARHRRHRRRHARGVPPRLRAPARGRRHAVARHGVVVARDRLATSCPRPRDDRCSWTYDHADSPVARRVHARRARRSSRRSTARSCCATAGATRVDADEVRAKAAEQADAPVRPPVSARSDEP